MRIGIVFHLLGRLCLLLAALLALPWAFSAWELGLGDDVSQAFLLTIGVSAACGLVLRLGTQLRQEEFGFSEAFATVTAVWIVYALIGALPFMLSGRIPSLLDACFETLSGFTTTGASILADPAALGRPLLFWRALTHWVGGMGIVALSVAILPALGAGGNFLFKAETAGPENQKLLPRISSTAKLLWGVYLGLTALQVLSLWIAGMDPFDAVCHSFATIATGGFGTRSDSMASFSPALQWITVVFMVAGGTNFVLLLSLARGRTGALLRNTEFRVYVALMGAVAALAFGVRFAETGAPDGIEALARETLFSVVSLCTTTGFANGEYSDWPLVIHPLLMLVMFTGACAGSTSGAAKMIRLVLWAKQLAREVKQLLHPSSVMVVKIGSRAIPEGIVSKTNAYLFAFAIVWGVGGLIMVSQGLGLEAGFSAMLTCMSNVGPGFHEVGPMSNYAGVTDVGKLALMGGMLLGRLEFFSLFVLLSPLAWRR